MAHPMTRPIGPPASLGRNSRKQRQVHQQGSANLPISSAGCACPFNRLPQESILESIRGFTITDLGILRLRDCDRDFGRPARPSLRCYFYDALWPLQG